MKSNNLVSVMFISLVVFLSIFQPINAQEQEVDVIILYSSTDSNFISTLDLNPQMNYHITNNSDIPVELYEQAETFIVVGSEIIDFSDSFKQEIPDFLDNPSKRFIYISPYFGELDGSVRDRMGITSHDLIEEDDNELGYTVTLDQAIGNYSQGKQFAYTGLSSYVETTSSAQHFATITEVNDTIETDLNYPILWNYTGNEAVVSVFALQVNTTSDDDFVNQNMMDTYSATLGDIIVDQLPVDDLIEELIIPLFQGIVSSPFQSSPNGTNTGTGTETNTGNTGEQGINLIPINNPLLILYLGLIGLGLLLLTKIRAIIEWISKRTYSLLFAIIGAYYNVQDRSIEPNQVLISQSRSHIMDYLEYIGEFGAHLREIKSTTDMGSGNVLWHLQMLEDYNYIEQYKIEGYTVFVAYEYVHKFDPKLKKIELNMQSKHTENLLTALSKISYGEKVLVKNIEDDTGISKRSLRRLIKKLHEHNIVELIRTNVLEVEIKDKSAIDKILENINLRKQYDYGNHDVRVDEIN